MQFSIIATLLLISAVSAQTSAPAQQNENRIVIQSLEARADTILQQVRKAIVNHRGEFSHLIKTLERHAISIEALSLDLKAQLADPDRVHHLHHIHVIEEELLGLENRVIEELEIVSHIATGNDQRGESGTTLVARAQKLVQDGQAAVAKHPQAPEAGEINMEIIVVEALIKVLQAKPNNIYSQKEEQELARQERTLRQLIDKANARKN